jgi:hypothetical protein
MGLIAAACAALLGLTGCSGLMTPVGSENFGCSRTQNPMEADLNCISFRGTVASTDGSLAPTRFDKQLTTAALDRQTGVAPTEGASSQPAQRPDAPVAPQPVRQALPTAGRLLHHIDAEPLAGRPVREAPVILRVRVNRWVDENDMLHEGTVLYREITPTRWSGFDPIPRARRASSAGQALGYPHRPAAEASGESQLRAPAVQPAQEARPARGAAAQAGQPLPDFTQPGSGGEASTGAMPR